MKIRTTIKIFILLFFISCLATCSAAGLSDGNNTIGFPFTFYEYLGGKRFPIPKTRTLFSWPLLLLDSVVIYAVAYGFCYLRKRVKHRDNSSKDD